MNEQNLIPLNQRSNEDAKSIREAGGKARAEQIRRRKTMREWAETFGAIPVKVKAPDGSTTDTDTLGNIVAAQMAKATKGDTKAAKFIAELLGEMEKTVNVKTPAPLVISEKEAEAIDKWTKE